MKRLVSALVGTIALLTLPSSAGAQQKKAFPGFMWGPANIPVGADLKVCGSNLSPDRPARLVWLFYGVGDSGKPIGFRAVDVKPKQGGCLLLKRDILPQQDPVEPPGQNPSENAGIVSPTDNAVIVVLINGAVIPIDYPWGIVSPADIGGIVSPTDLLGGIVSPTDYVGSAQITDPAGSAFGAILPFVEMPLRIRLMTNK